MLLILLFGNGNLALRPLTLPVSAPKLTVNSSSWAYADGTDVSLTVIVSSEVTNGYRGTDTISLEVRLHG